MDEVSVRISSDLDLVRAREQGRVLAGQLGFTQSDLTLVATAISELARNIVRYARRGEIVLRQSTGVVARLPISAQDITPCSWLNSASPGLSGYILTWSRTNHGERLSEIVRRKQTYDVHVAFVQPPPPRSSLWWSSMQR